MTNRVSAGEAILPHMTARWFNKTLQDAPPPPPPRDKEMRHHNEDMATFLPTEDCAKALRFTPVAPVGRTDTYGNRVSRSQYVNKENLTKFNWIIPQLEMAAGYLTQTCVYSGLTYAKVNILSESHRYVDLNLDTLELESSTRGKGVLLDIGSEYSLISIETYAGTGRSLNSGMLDEFEDTTTTQPITPVESECINECKWQANVGLTWDLVEDNCAVSTTSTTTSTTSSTSSTTTYDGYSRCKATTSTAPPPGVDDCECLHPNFCPTSDTQCTYTSCSTGTNSAPVCSSTSSTTTTSCDCNTTTTGLGCNCGFIEILRPDGLTEIVQVGFCPPGCDCIQEIPPSDPCNPDCNTRLTGTCVCPPPLPPCTDCIGSAEFICLPNCEGGFTWNQLLNQFNFCRNIQYFMLPPPEDDKQSSTLSCYSDTVCVPAIPTGPCTNCNEIITVGCVSIPLGSTSSTTTADICCTGPCASCYGCPSTTTSTSTTTTGPCATICTRRWNGSTWNIIDSDCPSPCYCGGVPYSGRDTCEVVQVPCITPPTTTTTTTTSTTSSTSSTTSTTTSTTTSSSTTTTECAVPDDCSTVDAITCAAGTNIVWTCSLDGIYAWRILGADGTCSDLYPGCFTGPAPSCDCSAYNSGQTRTGSCCQTTTSTTTSSSTTTTPCVNVCPEGTISGGGDAFYTAVDNVCVYSSDTCSPGNPTPPSCGCPGNGGSFTGLCCQTTTTTTSTSTTTSGVQGACCYGSGDCVFTDEPNCTSIYSGTFQGVGVPCDPDPC